MKVRSVRLLGGLFGGLAPGITALTGWWLGLDLVAAVAAWGIVPGILAGAILAPWSITAPRASLAALAAAGLGVALGILGVVIALGTGPSPQALVLVPVVGAYGIVLGFPVALPTAAVAVFLLRFAARRPRRGLAAAFVLTSVAGLLAVPAAAFSNVISDRHQLPALQPVPRLIALAPVRFAWEIANCSPWTYTLEILETRLDGSRSARSISAPARAAVRGVLWLEVGWTSTIAAEATADLAPAGRGPTPALRDALGAAMDARFEIAPNGERSIGTRRRPGEGVQIVPLCALGAPPGAAAREPGAG